MEIYFALIYFIIPSVVFFMNPVLGVVYCIAVLFLRALRLWFWPDLFIDEYNLRDLISD